MDLHNEVEHDTDLSASRAGEATRKGAQAFARLLQLAEQRSSGQIVRVVGFIAATYNGDAFKLDPFELRAVDIAISDDMLLCLDALRWARTDLYRLVPDGDSRVKDVIQRWGLRWPTTRDGPAALDSHLNSARRPHHAARSSGRCVRAWELPTRALAGWRRLARSRPPTLRARRPGTVLRRVSLVDRAGGR